MTRPVSAVSVKRGLLPVNAPPPGEPQQGCWGGAALAAMRLIATEAGTPTRLMTRRFPPPDAAAPQTEAASPDFKRRPVM